MAIPALIAGAGVAARGLASYLAKNKAKKAMMEASYGATRNSSIPHLVSSRGRVYPTDSLATGATKQAFVKQGSPSVFAKRLGLAGLGTGAGIYGADSLMNHPRNEAMNKHREGYMAGPMHGKSHDPSYEASRTREGRIQTMMEEMDGMNLSEEAKRQIIADKLSREKEYTITQDGMTYGVGFDSKPTDKVLRGLGEMKMFMGVPEGLRDKIERDKNTMNNDTAGWDPSQNIYPKFVIDQLIQNGTITPDEVFDLGASDGDSFKVIPKGTGRFDSARRA